MRRSLALVVTFAALALATSPALAHVEVLPAEVAQGEAVQFTIRVPTERAVATTRVAVEFPSQITVYSFAKPPGWTVRAQRGPDGRLRGVVYSGNEIAPNGYADFHVLGTPFASGTALWKTRQTYADGTLKPWTGPAETPGEESSESGPTAVGPSAAVTVLEPGQAVGGAAAAAGDGPADAGSGAGIWLGVIAIVISGLCLLGLGFLWSTRPARLPPDDEGR